MNNSTILYIVISLAVIVTIVVLIVKKRRENYHACVCTERGGTGRSSVCQDVDTVKKLYEENELTEYSTLKAPGWTKTSPGDYQFPVDYGCPWPNSYQNASGWQFWDFSDLAD